MSRIQRQRQATVAPQPRKIEMRVGGVGAALRRRAAGLLRRQLAKPALGDEIHDPPGRWIAVLERHRLRKHLDLLDRFRRQIADLLVSRHALRIEQKDRILPIAGLRHAADGAQQFVDRGRPGCGYRARIQRRQWLDRGVHLAMSADHHDVGSDDFGFGPVGQWIGIDLARDIRRRPGLADAGNRPGQQNT